MDAAIIPEDEGARLKAVRRYDVLDTPPDGAFDRITALAARHFRVPISIVSIVDTDRIWFKSHHGLDVQEIGRDPGLCASAILQDRPWVVEDAPSDPRALANPLVAGEFGLRFYAGAPLKTRDGYNLGTLCVIDHEPRRLSEEEQSTLEDMAAIVVDELELRLSARTAVDREQELRSLAERTARSLQASLLPPRLPDIPGIESAALYHPADRSEVGGDFYDIFPLRRGGCALVVGDVSGKGAEAAAVTALARHTVRTASLTADHPGDVMRVLNDAMFLDRGGADVDGVSDVEHFCTVHVSFLRPDGDGFHLSSASAGHPPALKLAAGSVHEVAASGPPVGWYEDAAFSTAEARLTAGEAVLVYTDGLSEARRGGELIGESEVVALLARSGGRSAQALIQTLQDLLEAPDVTVHDDAAALVVKVP